MTHSQNVSGTWLCNKNAEFQFKCWRQSLTWEEEADGYTSDKISKQKLWYVSGKFSQTTFHLYLNTERLVIVTLRNKRLEIDSKIYVKHSSSEERTWIIWNTVFLNFQKAW
jgi:hypothetical protein